MRVVHLATGQVTLCFLNSTLPLKWRLIIVNFLQPHRFLAAKIKDIPGLNLQGRATKPYLRGHTLLLKKNIL